ncbi:MAG TPA: hypothetical protein VFG21_02585 [Xanthomonadaceae bacterium]|nr:hypothetical protein [Xanthomonadaceae bacterium]
MVRLMVWIMLLAVAGAASAKDAISERKLNPQDFAEAKRYVINEMRTSKNYLEMSKSNRERVVEALDRMEARLDGVASVDELSENERVALFNDQELVNTLLSKGAEDSRLVCTRSRRTGSNRAQTVCHTVAERERMTRDGREAMRQKQKLQSQAISGG